ncbi:hypothetical protein BGZ80_003040, partial [Entomortierella chlamydospora]
IFPYISQGILDVASPTVVKNRISSIPKDAIDPIDFAVTFDHETEEKIMTIRLTLEGQHEPHTLYCDGSFINQGKVSARMGFAVVYENLDGTYPLATLGTAEGYASSNRAEIVGLLAAILCCPRNHTAGIYTDSTSVLHGFSALVQSQATKQKLLRSPNADWWGVIQKAYAQQGERATIHWVHAHSGVAGNMAADSWASKAHTAGLTAWQINKHRHNATST